MRCFNKVISFVLFSISLLPYRTLLSECLFHSPVNIVSLCSMYTEVKEVDIADTDDWLCMCIYVRLSSAGQRNRCYFICCCKKRMWDVLVASYSSNDTHVSLCQFLKFKKKIFRFDYGVKI